MSSTHVPPPNPGNGGQAPMPDWAKKSIGIIVGVVLVSDVVEHSIPAVLYERAYPDALPLSTIIFTLALAVYVILYAGRVVGNNRQAHGVVAFITLVILIALALVPSHDIRAAIGDPQGRPSYDLLNDRSQLVSTPLDLRRRASPGDELTVFVVLRNAGEKEWIDRLFCRWDRFNDRDNLRTAPCVRVPNTQPGATVKIPIRITVPERETLLLAEFKLADRDRNWFFSEERADPVQIVIEVSD